MEANTTQQAPQRFFYTPEEAKRLIDAFQTMAESAEYGIDDLSRQAGKWFGILLQNNLTTEPEVLAARAWQLARAFISERAKVLSELEGEPQE